MKKSVNKSSTFSVTHTANGAMRIEDGTLVSFSPERGAVFQHRRHGSPTWLEKHISTSRIIYLHGKEGVHGGATLVYEGPVRHVKVSDVKIKSNENGVMVGNDAGGATVVVRTQGSEIEREIGKLGKIKKAGKPGNERQVKAMTLARAKKFGKKIKGRRVRD